MLPAVKSVNSVISFDDGRWNIATDAARKTANARAAIVEYTQSYIKCGFSQNKAVEISLERLHKSWVQTEINESYQKIVGNSNKNITRSTLCDWLKYYKQFGKSGLLPNHKGRVKVSQEWEAIATNLFNQPSAPDMSAVHRHLVEVLGFSCSYNQIRTYLTNQPTKTGKFSPKRIGNKIHKLSEKPFISRDWDNHQAGEVYMADGYKADIQLAHPVTGTPWRPELTIAVDVASGAIISWRADNAENQFRVQEFWAQTFSIHDHVPIIVYLDNGAGYKNKQSLGTNKDGKIAKKSEQQSTTGYLQKMGVQKVQFGRPHNPHAKSFIERTNRAIKEDFLKMWRPQFYCGNDRNTDHAKWLHRQKSIQYPRLPEFTDAFNDWIIRFNNRPHPTRTDTTRAQIWAQRINIPVHQNFENMQKPQAKRIVQRARLRLNNREYQHPELYNWNHKEVIIEWDLDREKSISVRDLNGRLICEAPLVAKKEQFSQSYRDDLRKKAELAAIARKEKQIDEIKARNRELVNVDKTADQALELINKKVKQQDPEKIILDFDNL